MELSPNSIAFMALCNEFCHAVENSGETTRSDFTASMLRVLPRIYISASDLRPSPMIDDEDAYLESYLEEDYYESIRRQVENLFGEDDIFLEVFEEDMKYSDTPIGKSIAEGICDIFQVLYNFIAMVKDAPDDMVNMALLAVKDDFESYWSQKLCNILRPLNHLFYSSDREDGNEYDNL